MLLRVGMICSVHCLRAVLFAVQFGNHCLSTPCLPLICNAMSTEGACEHSEISEQFDIVCNILCKSFILTARGEIWSFTTVRLRKHCCIQCIHYNLLIHTTPGEHLDYFQAGVILKSAVMNILLYMSFGMLGHRAYTYVKL